MGAQQSSGAAADASLGELHTASPHESQSTTSTTFFAESDAAECQESPAPDCTQQALEHLAASTSHIQQPDTTVSVQQPHSSQPPVHATRSYLASVYLSARIVASNEDEGLQRAIAAVGWDIAPHASEAIVIFHYCTTANAGFHFEPGQILSRFPAMPDCCRKAIFSNMLGRLRSLLPPSSLLNDGRLLPAQWALPQQRHALREHVETVAAPGTVYIVKPDAGSQGKGIYLTPSPCGRGGISDGPYARPAVVQEYIANPLLLDGLKFDLRLYVLITSVGGLGDEDRPLRAFLYREGMVRFAVQPYQGADLKHRHAHLTNYSLNKNSKGFALSEDSDGGEGSKRTLSAVFASLQASGQLVDVDGLWGRIAELVSRSLVIMQPLLACARGQWAQNPCFQILGFDVLLDEQAQPWLVEINDHPSLRIDHVAYLPPDPSSGRQHHEAIESLSAVDEVRMCTCMCMWCHERVPSACSYARGVERRASRCAPGNGL